MAPATTTTSATVVATGKIAGYTAVAGVLNYLHIPHEGMVILGVLMALDFFTGVGKQAKVNAKEITSHAAWLGLMKKLSTYISVFSIALVFKYIDINPSGFIDTVIGIFIMAEGYSINQNIFAIRTGKILPEYDVISIFLKKFGDFLKNKIDKITNIKIIIQDQEEKKDETQI